MALPRPNKKSRREAGTKAMRGRLALQKHFVRNARRRLLFFAKAFGVRTRFRVALVDSTSSSIDKRFGCEGLIWKPGSEISCHPRADWLRPYRLVCFACQVLTCPRPHLTFERTRRL